MIYKLKYKLVEMKFDSDLEIIDICIWSSRFILRICMEKHSIVHKDAAFKTKNDICISHMSILANFRALSKALSLAYMENSGEYDV